MKLLTNNVLAVGGGKGGVGKSFFSSNIACGLAKSGRSVILVDADLAGSNIHLLFGIKYPGRTLNDYLKKKVASFADILIPTSLPNLSLICGASNILEIANPQYAQKQKMIGEIARLNADTIVIDIGAGSSLNNLDFFNAADTGILITTPSPTALQNAYGFLKMAVHRKILSLFAGDSSIKHELTAAFGDLDAFKSINHIYDLLERIDPAAAKQVHDLLNDSRFRLVVNMATEREGERVAKALAGVAYQFLNIHLPALGFIGYDPDVENSIRRMEPLLLGDGTPLHDTFMQMVRKLIEEQTAGVSTSPRPAEQEERQSATPMIESSSRVQISLHNEVLVQDTKLHVQTEDLGMEKAQIVTLVFSGGQILFSRKTDYREIITKNDVQHTVAERVKAQHRVMLTDIYGGLLTDALLQKKGP